MVHASAWKLLVLGVTSTGVFALGELFALFDFVVLLKWVPADETPLWSPPLWLTSVAGLLACAGPIAVVTTWLVVSRAEPSRRARVIWVEWMAALAGILLFLASAGLVLVIAHNQ